MYDKRQYPTFSHFRFLMSQLSRKTFSVLTELQNEKDKKNLAYFLFSYASFLKEERNFILLSILSEKVLTGKFKHLFSHGYYFNLPYLPSSHDY